ncbi:hypothetical protein SERLADRAFT_440051 [Serpula lacrymans var. lacrymans S7.9]|uniref:Uncharacterized protein n=1 Tax=Serpula lacrymans var. lacrymans (strain S7.9) TaxID=578457 RepID=F8P2E3_SERL9|nr:uncharacterized protein SERLADRAFT_440051 [Serpula lacrymans var. lacrymans S7.9]EGO23321.1 hypothetical protein SERLADRAFT_440051 [Serpula lacrymans var. lacrymans S7.9]
MADPGVEMAISNMFVEHLETLMKLFSAHKLFTPKFLARETKQGLTLPNLSGMGGGHHSVPTSLPLPDI